MREFARRHPFLLAWVALAAAMVAMLFVATRGVPLEPAQTATLVVSTGVLAALCVWIISWQS